MSDVTQIFVYLTAEKHKDRKGPQELPRISVTWTEVRTCGTTILLAIALVPQLFLNECADTCTASILAILSAIAQAQFKYDCD